MMQLRVLILAQILLMKYHNLAKLYHNGLLIQWLISKWISKFIDASIAEVVATNPYGGFTSPAFIYILPYVICNLIVNCFLDHTVNLIA